MTQDLAAAGAGEGGAAARKAAMRHEALARRVAAAAQGAHACAALAHYAEGFPAPQEVGSYVAIRCEMDPMPLAGAFMLLGARIAFPRVEGGHMTFRHFDPATDELVAGPFGLMQPGPDAPESVPDLVLVPLLAFDRRGHRLGYGAGYFDRWLAAHPHVSAVGLAFAAQEVERVPDEPHDRPLQVILTEAERIEGTRA